jgi:hypothetical protein
MHAYSTYEKPFALKASHSGFPTQYRPGLMDKKRSLRKWEVFGPNTSDDLTPLFRKCARLKKR